MTMDPEDSGPEQGPYALELHVRGLVHLQIERLPPVVVTATSAIISAFITWLTTR